MSSHAMMRPAIARMDRRQPLLRSSSRDGRMAVSVGEMAGGTMAECAAVCCCFPCGMANLLVLVAFKVPAGLFRRVIRRKRLRRRMKEGLLPPRRVKCGCDDDDLLRMQTVTSPLSLVAIGATSPGSEEMVELEKEMWEQFYAAGFWRSPSQRSEISVGHTI